MKNSIKTAQTVQYPEGTLHLEDLGLHFYSHQTKNGKFISEMWQGKSAKSISYIFRSEDSLASWVAQQITSAEYRVEAKARYKAEAAASKSALLDSLQVGQILHYSWGYEQTNCEFYQVVERKAKSVVIRPIASRTVKGISSMSEYVSPVRDAFLGEDRLTKVIRPYGLTMEHGTASPCDEKKEYYSSSYA